MTRTVRSRAPKLFDLLSTRAKLLFYVGVFFLFAPFSLLYDLASTETAAWWETAIWTVFAGLVAMGWAFAFTRDVRVLWLVVPGSLLAPAFFGASFWAQRTFPLAGLLGMLACLVVVVAAYVLFVTFISTEGARTMRLRAEIGLAKEIHEHLVPPVQLQTSGLELFGVSVPTTEVGGDLLDVVPRKGTTSVYVADVTGHGVPAGVLMGMVKSAIHMKLLDTDSLDTLVTDLNRVVYRMRKPGMFATFACLRFAGGSRVECCLAGHPPILHYRSRDGALSRIPNEHMPLGVVDATAFGAGTIDAYPGDLFVIVTDGLFEVFDREDHEFGLEALEQLIAAQAGAALSEIYARVLRAVHEHGPQTDDQTLLLARVLEATTPEDNGWRSSV